jgi:hypothetical protein
MQDPKSLELKKKETCISEQGVHALAERERKCQKCDLDLKTIKAAYEVNLKETHPKLQVWQQPTFVIGGFAVSLGLGALFVGSHCFGLCN